jgi:hypothetical protein
MRWVKRCKVLAATVVLVGVAAACTPTGPSARPAALGCDGAKHGGRLVPSSGVWFGVSLDWEHDRVADYATRLGHAPAVAVAFAALPLEAAGWRHVQGVAEQVEGSGGMLLLTLEPRAGLAAITAQVASTLAARLATLNGRGVPVLVRFGHEMNGSWYPWAQQPAAYVAAFRRVADAVHRGARLAATVWAPNYGGGYPFPGGRYAAHPGTAGFDALDRDHDGALTMADDPYAPYYPGDDVVDWVGMSLYHWGARYPWGANVVPEPAKFPAMLTGSYAGATGDERAVPDFYASYGDAHGKPVAVLETAAFYAPGNGGAPTLAVKQAWWHQVLSPDLTRSFPRLRMVNWFEWRKHEPEVHAVVDWTVTRDPAQRAAFRAQLPAWLRYADAVDFCRG